MGRPCPREYPFSSGPRSLHHPCELTHTYCRPSFYTACHHYLHYFYHAHIVRFSSKYAEALLTSVYTYPATPKIGFIMIAKGFISGTIFEFESCNFSRPKFIDCPEYTNLNSHEKDTVATHLIASGMGDNSRRFACRGSTNATDGFKECDFVGLHAARAGGRFHFLIGPGCQTDVGRTGSDSRERG
jgi:hypothetical protein